MKLKKLLAILVACAMVSSFAIATTVTASATAGELLINITDFTGKTTAEGGQYLNGYGIQRMTWDNAGAPNGTFAGTTIAVEGNVFKISNANDTNGRGFQFQEHYSSNQKFQGETGKTYTVIMEASGEKAGSLRISPDNHPAGVAKSFDLPTTKTKFMLTWVQVEHQHNNLQIWANVDWTVYSIIIHEGSPFDCMECEDSGDWCDECNPEPDCLECEDSGAWCDECNPEPQLPDEKVDITLYPGEWGGAVIDTANLVEGETYHLRVAFKLGDGGNGGIRVRYNSDVDGPYNDGPDGPNANEAAHIKGNLFKAGGIPAHIPGNSLANGSAIVLDIDFVFGGGLDNMDDTEFITVFGMWGTADYEVTGVIITNSDRLVIGMAGDQPMDDAGANVFPPADDGDDADGAGGGDSDSTTSGGGSGGGSTGTGSGGGGSGSTDSGSDDDDKADAPTGAASVAIVAGLATLAAATVVIARRRK